MVSLTFRNQFPTPSLGTSVTEFFLVLRLKECLFVRHASVHSLAKDAGQVLVDQIRMGEAVNWYTIDEMVITQDPFSSETKILENSN